MKTSVLSPTTQKAVDILSPAHEQRPNPTAVRPIPRRKLTGPVSLLNEDALNDNA